MEYNKEAAFYDRKNVDTFYYLTHALSSYTAQNPSAKNELVTRLFGVNGERELKIKQRIEEINFLADLIGQTPRQIIDDLFRGNIKIDDILLRLEINYTACRDINFKATGNPLVFSLSKKKLKSAIKFK